VGKDSQEVGLCLSYLGASRDKGHQIASDPRSFATRFASICSPPVLRTLRGEGPPRLGISAQGVLLPLEVSHLRSFAITSKALETRDAVLGYSEPMTMPAIDIDKLTTEQRLHLLELLWESLRKTPDALPLPDAQREEFDRRLDDLDRGDVATIPWEEVKRQLHGRKQ